MSGARTLRGALAVVMLYPAACADQQDVRIIGQCRVVNDAARLVESGADTWPVGATVVRFDGLMLVSWDEMSARGLAALPPWASRRARWFDSSMAALTEPQDLGRTYDGYRTLWVPVGAELVGQVWTDPTNADRTPRPPMEEMVAVVHASPPPSATFARTPVDYEAAPRSCEDCANASLGAGAGDGPLPIVAGSDGLIGAFVGPPRACPSGVSNYNRPFAFDRNLRAQVVRWYDPACPADALTDNGLLTSTNPWLVATVGGTAMLFRLGGPGGDGFAGALAFLRLDGLAPDAPPRRVGSPETTDTEDGYLPRAVAVPGRKILFTERRSARNACHRIRVMNDDGTDARDGPWQLPCTERADTPLVVRDVELLSVPGGAVLVWAQHSGGASPLILPGAPFEESVRAVLLTPEGERGSEVLQVTDPAATTYVLLDGDPYAIPGYFLPHAASSGAQVTVVWQGDVRVPDAPAIYGRTIECVVDR